MQRSLLQALTTTSNHLYLEDLEVIWVSPDHLIQVVYAVVRST